MKKIISIIAFSLIIIGGAFSQNNIVGKQYVYEFRDGTTIIGAFVKDEAGNIYINDLKGNETYLPRVMVAQIHEVTTGNLKDGEYWFPNLHDSRYFFSPSAFGLEQGEGYFGHSYWMLWQTQYGISDNFSIGGGTTPWGLPATLNAKYSFNINDDYNAAMGWFWVGDLFGHTDGEMGSLLNMPYAVITKGSKENNITLGAAYNFATPFSESGPNISSERLVLNAGGISRISRRFSFVFEVWLLNSENDGNTEFHVMGGPGIRYFRKINRVTAKNGAGAKTWDFQLVHFPGFGGENGGPTFLPMIGASQKF
tara:strand:- start:1185 stop:2114 length:930 start_codon:yes stop_codon:yes gene_type:complete